MKPWLPLLVILIAAELPPCGWRDESIARPPMLRDEPVPAIPGLIAYMSGKRLEFDSCIAVLPASGSASPTTVTCDYPSQSDLVWIDESRLGLLEYTAWRRDWIEAGVKHHEPAQRVYLLSVSSGVITPSDLFGYLEYDYAFEHGYGLEIGEHISVRGERAEVDAKGRVLIDSVEVAKFEGVRDRLHPGLWSPDGEWLLLWFSAEESGEIWVIRRDGSVKRTLVTDTSGDVSWIIPGVGTAPRFVSVSD